MQDRAKSLSFATPSSVSDLDVKYRRPTQTLRDLVNGILEDTRHQIIVVVIFIIIVTMMIIIVIIIIIIIINIVIVQDYYCYYCYHYYYYYPLLSITVANGQSEEFLGFFFYKPILSKACP